MGGDTVAITGFGMEVPGLSDIGALLTLAPLSSREFDPAPRLGHKGLRYKDRATQLALCAVQDALGRAQWPLAESDLSEGTGVVVSSNLGNADTVCRMVQTVRDGSTRNLSVMDAPNASSNVIASTIAIRHGYRAANLTLCNGATSGIDALYTAANMIRSDRARRVIVVGVEPSNEIVQRLMEESHVQSGGVTPAPHVGEGAACIILEAASHAADRGVACYGTLLDYRHFPDGIAKDALRRHLLSSDRDPPSLWLVPNRSWLDARSIIDNIREAWDGRGPDILDLSSKVGDLYGALGVFQCVAACLWFLEQAVVSKGIIMGALMTAGGTWGDGIASMLVRSFP